MATKTIPEVLPQGYYLTNFTLLLQSVVGRYADILTPGERAFEAGFAKLSEDARRLYVRLVSRKGPLFRSDRLAYDDVPDITAAQLELCQAGYLEIGGEYDVADALRLLRVGELRERFDDLPVGLRKDDVLALVVEAHGEQEIREVIDRVFDVLSPAHSDTVSTFLLLFFGNAHQDLSEFVVTDLGHVRYEQYQLDPATRPFLDRNAIEAALAYHSASEQLYDLSLEHDADGLEALAHAVRAVEFPQNLMHRRDRLVNATARQLEREDRKEQASALYADSSYPPSRERRARIACDAERFSESAQLLREMIGAPISEEESEFAPAFMSRQHKKHGAPFEEIDTGRFAPPSHRVVLRHEPGFGVEEVALKHATSDGSAGWWCENALINGLFGLTFWDIIFAPLPGAFHNPFQRGPSDLMLPDFRRNRKEAISERIREMDRERWRERIITTYREKQGIANSFLNWKRFPEELVLLAVERIPVEHLAPLFDRLSRDVRANTAGFPDLVVFPEQGQLGDYSFVEVKGPGDQLQKNQLRWMRHFSSLGVPYSVLWVEWEG